LKLTCACIGRMLPITHKHNAGLVFFLPFKYAMHLVEVFCSSKGCFGSKWFYRCAMRLAVSLTRIFKNGTFDCDFQWHYLIFSGNFIKVKTQLLAQKSCIFKHLLLFTWNVYNFPPAANVAKYFLKSNFLVGKIFLLRWFCALSHISASVTSLY